MSREKVHLIINTKEEVDWSEVNGREEVTYSHPPLADHPYSLPEMVPHVNGACLPCCGHSRLAEGGEAI